MAQKTAKDAQRERIAEAMAAAVAAGVSETALKEPYFEDVPIDLIRTDGDTQQRPMDADALAEYTARCEAGQEPPPGRAVKEPNPDDKTKPFVWLWSGFHRLEALKRAGATTMRLGVTRGTKRDAQYLSYTANAEHGVRRQAGVVEKIVRKMLDDPAWKKQSARAIAAFVDCSPRYVEKIISDRKATKRAAGEADDRGADRKVSRGGTEYEMRASTGGNGEPAEPKFDRGPDDAEPESGAERLVKIYEDATGATIDDEDIAEIFGRAKEIRELMRTVSAVKKSVLNAAAPDKGSPDPLFRYVNPSAFNTDVTNVYRDLADAIPYALCPVHGPDAASRKGCEWCRGSGWLTKPKHAAATESMRAAAKEAK